ncbi:MAG: signal peptide peptidase SppA [Mariprofundaceae bacterium]
MRFTLRLAECMPSRHAVVLIYNGRKTMFSGLMRWLDRIRRWFINGLFLLFITIFLVAIFSSKPEVPENAVLVLDLKGKLVEQIERPDSDTFPLALPTRNQILIQDVVDALKMAKQDPHIKALRLDLGKLQKTSLSKLQDLRRAIDDFKSSGKPVIVDASAYSQSQYYLAATADHLFLHPMGMVELIGFSLYRNYFKEALEKLHVDVHVFKVGTYKSAIEPLIRNDMSDADLEANQAWLKTLWQVYKDDVANMRGIKAERIQTILDTPSLYLAQHQGNVAQMLKAEKLVDDLKDRHETDIYIAQLLHIQNETETPQIRFKTYLKAADPLPSPKESNNWIGVITASGPILNGKQPGGSIGGDSMARLLRDARLDKRVKAVVLRIDSPGGSALASEVIRKEVKRVQAAGKPVLVSMGSMAASGGYWIAAPADEIWAKATTLTGSIGVFGVMPNLHDSLSELGIHTDGLGTTNIAAGLRSDMPLPVELQKTMQMGVENVYKEFLQHVSNGRDMDIATVDKLAQGRVWSGIDAHRIGLVDKLGNLNDVIIAAAKRANISGDYKMVPIEVELSPADMLAEMLLGEAQGRISTMIHSLLPQAWIDIMNQTGVVSQFNDPRNIYAYSELPF